MILHWIWDTLVIIHYFDGLILIISQPAFSLSAIQMLKEIPLFLKQSESFLQASSPYPV